MVFTILRAVSLWVAVAVISGASGIALDAVDGSKHAFRAFVPSAQIAHGAQGEEELQWFKDQMKISEQYVEDHDGIWGMSWGHFFTMVFLVLVALGALVVFIQRQRRTRETLEIIRKEMQHGDSG